jgi:hypothetical protein
MAMAMAMAMATATGRRSHGLFPPFSRALLSSVFVFVFVFAFVAVVSS